MMQIIHMTALQTQQLKDQVKIKEHHASARGTIVVDTEKFTIGQNSNLVRKVSNTTIKNATDKTI